MPAVPSGAAPKNRPRLVAGVLAVVATVALTGCQGSSTRPFPEGVKDAPPCASPPSVTPGAPAPDDWPTFDRTPDRSGDAGGAQVSGHLSSAWAARVDGAMFAQPLVAKGLVIEATERDTVYAFDAARGCLVWKTTLGMPFDVTVHRLECGNIEPTLGITDTPAVDTTTGTVYAVAYFDPGRYEMDALDLRTGAVRWRHPIDLPGSDMLLQLSRPAIALANGRAYASFGGRAGDCGNYHGFVVGVNEDGQGPDVRYQVSPNREGAVWAPGGPVVLPDGDLLVSTGNTDETQQWDGSDAVVRLSPSLQRVDFFTPADWVHLGQADLDLGSESPTVVGGGMLFEAGKEGVGYLLDENHLGGIGGQLSRLTFSGGCLAIGAAVYRPPYVYVPCQQGLAAVRLNGQRMQSAWRSPAFASGSPIVAGGLVWDFDWGNSYLWAFDPTSGAVRQKLEIGAGEHFASPSASAGRLYVPVANRLEAFTLT